MQLRHRHRAPGQDEGVLARAQRVLVVAQALHHPLHVCLFHRQRATNRAIDVKRQGLQVVKVGARSAISGGMADRAIPIRVHSSSVTISKSHSVDVSWIKVAQLPYWRLDFIKMLSWHGAAGAGWRVPGQLARHRARMRAFDQTWPWAGEGAGLGCGKLAHLPQAQRPQTPPACGRWAKACKLAAVCDWMMRSGSARTTYSGVSWGKRRAAASGSVFGPQVAEQLAHERVGAGGIRGVVHFDVHPGRRQTRAACLGRACYFL